MKRVLVFSKRNRLRAVKASFARRPDLQSFGGQQPLLIYQEDNCEFRSCDGFEHDGLYLVFDEIEQKAFTQLTQTLEQGELYILKHRRPTFSLEDLRANILIGQNESNGKYYPDLIKVIENSLPDKLTQVVTTLFSADPLLEIKLDLLYACLRPEAVNEQLFPAELAYDTSAYTAFGELISKASARRKNSEQTGNTNIVRDDFFAELARFRDVLLDQQILRR
jgi:hypothetical protein